MNARRLFGVLARDASAARLRAAGLQRAIPVGMIDVRLAHLDAMLVRIAHDLGWRVEAHRLRVQQRAAKTLGIAALEPARRIDEQREARGMALGKAVLAEAFDLAEAAFGEIAS